VFFVTWGWAGAAAMITVLATLAGILAALLLSGPTAHAQPGRERTLA